MKKRSIAGSLAALLVVVGNASQTTAEAAKLPPSGTTRFTTYFGVHPAHELKMVDGSSITIAELVGITDEIVRLAVERRRGRLDRSLGKRRTGPARLSRPGC